MKKSSIALGVAALLASTAYAGISATSTSAVSMAVNPNGVGHQLVVPYYSVQNGNVTLLNIVNHDTSNGKAVKVRFRGAANSDDVFDFQVLLSPGDVWTAAVTTDANGVARLSTADKSCTIPNGGVNVSFPTGRLDTYSTKSVAEQTREGYIEIINMADIPKNPDSSSLYANIKHVNGVPGNCAAAETKLKSLALLDAGHNEMVSVGLANPTTGLSADWIILNQSKVSTWTGSAVALQAVDGSGNAATGNIVFSPQLQIGGGVGATTTSLWTADQILVQASTTGVTPQPYDFPDLSTPYVSSSGTQVSTIDQVILTHVALNTTSIANEFVTDPAIGAMTDWVITQPVRRYYAAVNYKGGTDGKTATALYTDMNGSATGNGNVYETYAKMSDRVLCLREKAQGDTFLSRQVRDREETLADAANVTVSPAEPGALLLLCGEAAVMSFNAGSTSGPSSLDATLARNNIEVPYTDGWMRLNTQWAASGTTNGLAIVGYGALRANNGSKYYGFTWPHKTNY